MRCVVFSTVRASCAALARLVASEESNFPPQGHLHAVLLPLLPRPALRYRCRDSGHLPPFLRLMLLPSSTSLPSVLRGQVRRTDLHFTRARHPCRLPHQPSRLFSLRGSPWRAPRLFSAWYVRCFASICFSPSPVCVHLTSIIVYAVLRVSLALLCKRSDTCRLTGMNCDLLDTVPRNQSKASLCFFVLHRNVMNNTVVNHRMDSKDFDALLWLEPTVETTIMLGPGLFRAFPREPVVPRGLRTSSASRAASS